MVYPGLLYLEINQSFKPAKLALYGTSSTLYPESCENFFAISKAFAGL